MIPASSCRRWAALPGSTPPAGPARPRISGSRWSGFTASSATRTAAPDLSRSSRSPGRAAAPNCFAARSKAASPGRRGAIEASATIRYSSRKARTLTFGEIDPAEKHRISHRARAFAKLVERYFSGQLSRSPSTSIGRSAGRNAPIAISTAMSATASTRRAGRGRSCAISNDQAELTAGRAVGSVFFGGGTPSLMPPETVAEAARRGTVALGRYARCRNHPRGQPQFRRSRSFPCLCGGRGQPAVARGSGARPGGLAPLGPRP